MAHCINVCIILSLVSRTPRAWACLRIRSYSGSRILFINLRRGNQICVTRGATHIKEIERRLALFELHHCSELVTATQACVRRSSPPVVRPIFPYLSEQGRPRLLIHSGVTTKESAPIACWHEQPLQAACFWAARSRNVCPPPALHALLCAAP